MMCWQKQSIASFFILGLMMSSSRAQEVAQVTPGTGVNFEARLNQVEEDMRSLNGKTEQLDFAVHRIEQDLQRLQSDIDDRLSKLEHAKPVQSGSVTVTPPKPMSAVSPVNSSPPQSSVSDPASSVNGTLGALRLQDGKVTGGVINPVAPPLPSTPSDFGLTSQELYDRAFDQLRKTHFDDAERDFKSFIDKYPKDKLTENARYWYGETLYVKADYAAAAVAFAEAYQQNPQGMKAPDSLLKLAMSLETLDKVADACTTLLELKSKFPNATPTVKNRADEERIKLKCGRS